MTLFITERSAFRAAEAAIAGNPNLSLRVLSASVRNPDRSTDRGFKVLLVDRQRNRANYL